MAAALAYGLDRSDNSVITVYDLGGILPPRAAPRGRASSANSSDGSAEHSEHRSARPRPPDLHLSASGISYQSSMGDGSNGLGLPSFQRYQSSGEYGQHGQVDSRQVCSMNQPQMWYQ